MYELIVVFEHSWLTFYPPGSLDGNVRPSILPPIKKVNSRHTNYRRSIESTIAWIINVIALSAIDEFTETWGFAKFAFAPPPRPLYTRSRFRHSVPEKTRMTFCCRVVGGRCAQWDRAGQQSCLTSFALSGSAVRATMAVPLHANAVSSTNAHHGVRSSAGISITSSPMSRSART